MTVVTNDPVTNAAANVTSGLASAAGTAATVITDVMNVEPMVMSILAAVVPGAAPVSALVQPWIVMAAPYLEQALTAIAASNGNDMLNAFSQLLSHITVGLPNAPALSPVATPPAG